MGQLLATHDAMIAAVGAPVPESPDLPGEKLDGVMNATEFLTMAKGALATGKAVPDFKGATVPVLVLGGSDTAIDVARSIIRLGGKPVIIHRREERLSRARADDILEAKNEGVEFRFATNLVKLEGENGALKRATLVRTQQKGQDMAPRAIKGTEQTIDARMVVLATGYKLQPAFTALFGLPPRQTILDRLLPDRRWVASGIFTPNSQIGKLAWEREFGLRASASPRREKLWVVGDALLGPGTVVGAMAQGRLAARSVLEKRLHSPTV
jgi:glutamate synthase (NADPH/NADH) small chain